MTAGLAWPPVWGAPSIQAEQAFRGTHSFRSLKGMYEF